VVKDARRVRADRSVDVLPAVSAGTAAWAEVLAKRSLARGPHGDRNMARDRTEGLAASRAPHGRQAMLDSWQPRQQKQAYEWIGRHYGGKRAHSDMGEIVFRKQVTVPTRH